MNISELITVKPVSIYCIINKQDKRIYITSTIETIGSLMHNLKRIREGEIQDLYEDIQKLELCIIETYNKKNKLYLEYRVQELYDEYIQNGYSPYSLYKPIRWKVQIKIDVGTDHHKGNDYRANVCVKTSVNFTHIVRSFKTIEEAEHFVQNNTLGQIVRML